MAVDFLDEFAGVPFVGAPDVRTAFGLRYETAALVLFALPRLAGLLLEAPLYVLADRFPRKPFVVGGLGALGLFLAVAGASPNSLTFGLALALAGATSGIGVNLAQATLVDVHPEDGERLMARWAFMGALGDLATPVLFASLAAFALGWREAFLTTGLLFVIYAAALLPFRFPAARVGADGLPPVRAAVRSALASRGLLLWLFGVWLCGMMDEILVAFAALRLDALGASVGERSLILAGFVGGSLTGLLATDRLLRRVDAMRLLRAAGTCCALAYGAWILAEDSRVSGVLLAIVGFCASPLYPIAQAQAYRALPGQSGLVNAVGTLFAPLDVALPFVLGLVADRAGLGPALTVLALQPLGLLIIASGRAQGRGPGSV